QATAEVLGDDDDAADAPGGELTLERRDVAAADDQKIARVLESLRETERRGARVLQRQADAGPGHVEGDCVAEEEQQDERQDEGDEKGGRVAQDLQRLLDEHRAQAASGEVHAASRSRSDSSIRAMNASSRVGSLRWALAATAALSSSGVPVAICVAR